MNRFDRSIFLQKKRCACMAAVAGLLLFLPAAFGQEPVADSGSAAASRQMGSNGSQPESELVFNGLGSFGHFHIFANSWWSDLDIASIEYDRHSWGYAAHARLDYSAEFQPLMVLRQPSATTVWGTPETKQRETLYGIGIMPIGMRMLWRDKKNFKPYLAAKGGLDVFNQKTLSSQASYFNFTLRIGVGTQFRLSPRWDGRVGFTYFHMSDAFVVPSNPGLDSMMYTAGLSYHLHGRR